MMILDAINDAASEHAVYFLVTSYIESLHHFHRSLGIPERVVKLPVGGVRDLEERLDTLRLTGSGPMAGEVPAAEVSAVLASAVQRLACEAPQA